VCETGLIYEVSAHLSIIGQKILGISVLGASVLVSIIVCVITVCGVGSSAAIRSYVPVWCVSAAFGATVRLRVVISVCIRPRRTWIIGLLSVMCLHLHIHMSIRSRVRVSVLVCHRLMLRSRCRPG